MDIAALIVAVGALVIAYLAYSRAQVAGRDLDKALARAGTVEAELKEARAALEARIDEVRREVRRNAGTLRFRPEMTIADAMQMHPGVAAVLAEFQLGGCSNCAVSDVDTLEGACRSYNLDLEALLAALNRLVDGKPEEPAKPIDVSKMRVKM